MNPLDLLNAGSPPAQDFIILNGKKSPGRATVTGAGSPRKWDEQGGFGIDGATLVYMGNGLAEFDVLIDLWEPKHWGEWNAFAKLLEAAERGVRAKALEIVHPLLNRAPLKITAVVIRDVLQFEQSKTGMYTCRIPFKVFRAPRPMLKKPAGTIPAATSALDPFANDPQIAALMARQASLGGVL